MPFWPALDDTDRGLFLEAFLGHRETASCRGKLWRPLPVINSVVKIPSKVQIISSAKLAANLGNPIFIFK